MGNEVIIYEGSGFFSMVDPLFNHLLKIFCFGLLVLKESIGGGPL